MKIKMKERTYGSNKGTDTTKFLKDGVYETHDGPEFSDCQISHSLAGVWLGTGQCEKVEEKAEKKAPSNKAHKKAPENK